MPTSRLQAIAAAAASLGIAACSAQSIQQPSSDTSVTSFSGQGSIPFQYQASDASAVSSIDVAIVQDDLDFVLANGLLGDSGQYNAVFAPLSGFCGQVALRVTENQGNSSSDPTSQDFTITCGPVQRTRSLAKRQDGGGPSGSLSTPSGGTSYESPDGAISITYRPVTEGGQTFGIDAALVSDLGNYTLTNGLWKANSSQDISANFAIPSGACGPFNLQITEHQFYQNGAISFQAASPSVNISCASGSDGNTNATVPSTTNSTRTALPTSTGVNATSTTSNSTGTFFSTSMPSNNTTSAMILTNSTTPVSTATSTTITNSTAILSTSTTSISTNSSSGSTTATPTNSTSLPSTSSTAAVPTFTGNITLPIETSTITEPTTIVSTVTTTFTESGQTGTVTSIVTTTVSPSSTSSSSTSNSTTSSSTSTSSSSSSSSTSRSSEGGGGGGSIRTTTVTATPSSQGNGITTVTITPTSTPTATRSVTPERRTSTYTTTEVVVVAQPGRSSITSTRLQTVILVSQTIAAIVQPSQSGNTGGSAAPNSSPTGAALVAAQIMPWSITVAVCLMTIAVLQRAL